MLTSLKKRTLCGKNKKTKQKKNKKKQKNKNQDNKKSQTKNQKIKSKINKISYVFFSSALPLGKCSTFYSARML